MTTDTINRFAGRYAFLSNFHVEADGLSGEHRFQAAKTLDPAEHARVLAAKTPGASKGVGRHVHLRADWERVKVSVMVDVVTQKFEDPALRTLLLDTGDAELVEGNTWGDVFWGVDLRSGEGLNVLGQILMGVRASIRQELEATSPSLRPEAITRFQGEHRFLSNFWPTADGKTVEHVYQAAKCADSDDSARILALPTAGEAKRAGQEVVLRADWSDVRVQVMADAVARKFVEPELRQMLLDTGDAKLVEGNTWGDVFWGVDMTTGEGRNALGILLMGVRASLRAARNE